MSPKGQSIVAVKQFSKAPYAWPGGYPQYAITSDSGALCASCCHVNLGAIVTAIAQHLSDGWRVEAIEVNWEDADLYCDHCNKHIESAYGA